MPASEVDVTPDLARALLADQHPDLADRPIVLAESGWDNVMLRLGDDLALRLPRRSAAAGLALNEHRWLPMLGPRLPLPTPIPLRTGAPALGYPFQWSVVPWLDGTPSDLAPPGVDEGERLAAFLLALHQPAPAEAPPNPYRGVPLAERSAAFEDRAAEGERIGAPVKVLREAWRAGLAAPRDAPPVWLHGDLHGRNVLVKEGRLSAVIDWGDVTGGDPACDLAAVWMLLPHPDARRRAVAAYPASAATWTRARAWAALMAAMLLPVSDNPRMPAMGREIARRLGTDA
jgi:aminoglycoside phosphotransferase (APT) family kinase protein